LSIITKYGPCKTSRLHATNLTEPKKPLCLKIYAKQRNIPVTGKHIPRTITPTSTVG
jgi:hypothetical protein